MRARWFTADSVDPQYVAEHFIPLALDTYFRGNSHEVEFCQKVRAGGNHLVACTAGGERLGEGKQLKLRERELGAVVKEFQSLDKELRQPNLADADEATQPRRPVPDAPKNGLVIRGFCTYLQQANEGEQAGQIERATRFYYEQNPDRWAAETQSDMLWLTEAEWKSLVPADPQAGEVADVSDAIQQRFYSTIGIDYMEGSVNSLPPRDTRMTLTVEHVTDEAVSLRLEGHGTMGKPLDDKSKSEKRTRGCELNLLGYLRYDRRAEKFVQFDLVGVGHAWGNKMEYVNREIKLKEYPWTYGVACELVTGDSPIDRIPPYNLLHYNSVGDYFGTSNKEK